MQVAVNQIVQGHKAGVFIVLALRTVGGEQGAQVKTYDPISGKAGRGEMFLPLDALEEFEDDFYIEMGDGEECLSPGYGTA